MRKKRLVLAFLLALTTVVPAHASGAETILKSEILLQPTIEVTVPQSGRVILNPYGLPTEIDGRTTTEQIVCEAMPIVNNSDVPVIVSASTVGQVSEGSSAVYVPVPPQADAVEKEIFLYTEFQPMNGLWTGAYNGASNQILISENSSEPKEVLLIDAFSQGMFRLFGATTVQPTNPWGAEDEIAVTIIFTFIPLDIPPTEGQISEPEVSPMPEVSLEPEVLPAPEISLEPEMSPEPMMSPVPEVFLEPESSTGLAGSLLPEGSLGP